MRKASALRGGIMTDPVTLAVTGGRRPARRAKRGKNGGVSTNTPTARGERKRRARFAKNEMSHRRMRAPISGARGEPNGTYPFDKTWMHVHRARWAAPPVRWPALGGRAKRRFGSLLFREKNINVGEPARHPGRPAHLQPHAGEARGGAPGAGRGGTHRRSHDLH